MADIIKLKRGQSTTWASKNIVLKDGEPGVELDSHQMKVGDGKTAWKDLPYVGNGQSVELPENIMKFLGVVSELPESAEDNTVCLMDNIVYIYSNNSWQVFHNNGSIGVIKIIGDDSRTDGFEVNGVKYNNFSDALNNAPAGSTIILQQNIDTLPIIAGKNVAIDLNNIKIVNNEGKIVEAAYDSFLVLKGEGTLECNKHGQAPVENNGNTTIKGGNYQRSIDEKGNGYYVIVNHGNMTIDDGFFTSPGGLSSLIENGYYNYSQGYVAGKNQSEPTLIINGGTFIDMYTTIKNDDNGITTINGGSFYGSVFNVGKSLTINGGEITCTDGYGCVACNKSNENINKADCIITGGKFTTNGDTIIMNSGNAHIEISGGQFNKAVPAEYIKIGYTQKLENGYYNIVKEG